MKFDCVVFDMDGTLTEAYLDFSAIRADLGIAPDQDILGAMAAMDETLRAEAERRLLAHEMAAANNAPMAEGAGDVVRRIRGAGLATALLTRNSRQAMQAVLRRSGLEFDVAVSREDGPIKPNPQSILTTCRRLGVRPGRTACVGDWVFDIEAANAAGCLSILLARGRLLDFADQADHVIQAIPELIEILEIPDD